MARFVVTLWLSSNPDCRVERKVTRADTDRAIFYATELLHKSRMSTRILWMWFDRWTVEEEGKDGERGEATTGEAEPKESHKAGHRKASKAPPKRRASPYSASGIITGRATRKVRVLSPFQQRMQRAMDEARERLNGDGTVSRMGSDTHD